MKLVLLISLKLSSSYVLAETFLCSAELSMTKIFINSGPVLINPSVEGKHSIYNSRDYKVSSVNDTVWKALLRLRSENLPKINDQSRLRSTYLTKLFMFQGCKALNNVFHLQQCIFLQLICNIDYYGSFIFMCTSRFTL